MAKLYFRYGDGKSAQLCQVAYNYKNERNMDVLVINAKDNEPIISKIEVEGKKVLVRDPNFYVFDDSIYEQIYDRWLMDNVKCILVDNAEYLTPEQAENLFYVSKLLDIPVIAYGHRMLNGCIEPLGVLRLMALADEIERIDMGMSLKRATLDFNFGAMNSSKTAELLTRCEALERYGNRVCVIKPRSDRNEFHVESRIGLRRKADIVLDDDSPVYGEAVYLFRNRTNYIFVDEAQFLTSSQIDQLRRIVDDYDIPVSCYGLKSDFLSRLFPGSKRLLEVSDNFRKLKTVCDCGEGANFNVRKDKFGNYVTQGNQVEIDTGDNYDSECAICFMEHVMGIDTTSKARIRKK